MAGIGPELRIDDALGRENAAAPLDAAASRCRNCGADARGVFCARCGQETAIALPTARQFLKEAAGRYVAWDGRLWRTLALLVFRPGFLTRAYLAGRRRRYIRPARLFLVLSLVLFAVLRFAIDVPVIETTPSTPDPPAALTPGAGKDARRTGDRVEGLIALPFFTLRIDDDANLVAEGASGPVGERFQRRLERFNHLSREDKSEQLFLGIVRYGPYAMFVLLPAFAFLLWLAYYFPQARYPQRPRRYAEHLVFAAHNHAFVFLIALALVLAPWRPLAVLACAWALAYGLWSMKAMYGGRWTGLLGRAWLVGVAYLVLFMAVTVGLVLAAVIVR